MYKVNFKIINVINRLGRRKAKIILFFAQIRDLTSSVQFSRSVVSDSHCMLAVWSVVPLPFLKPAWTSGRSRFTYCWSLAWRILSIILLVQLCSSLSILWHCLSLGLDWKLTFSSPMATVEFSKFAGILSAALSQHHLSGFEIAPLKFHHLH